MVSIPQVSWGLHSVAGKFHIRVFHQHVAKGIAQGVIFSSDLKPAQEYNMLSRSATDFAALCAKARHIAPVYLFFFHGLQ